MKRRDFMKKIISFIIVLFILIHNFAFASGQEFYNEVTTNGFRIVYTEKNVVPSPRGSVNVYGKCGVLNAVGEFVVEPVYDSITPFKEGRALFKKDGKYGFFDENWQIAIEPKYVGAGEFSEGLANVAIEGGLQGYIDIFGNTVIPFEYSSTAPFKNSIAAVGGRAQEGYSFHTFIPYGKIDKYGNTVEPLIFDHSGENLQVIKSQSMIEINGVVYDNRDLAYPFINYLGYAYIPLTFEACRALGILTQWSEETGLVLSKGSEDANPPVGTSVMADGVYEQAYLCEQPLTINGKVYRHTDIYYPLISYKNVVYLPVLWRQGMEELGIEYEYVLPQGMEGKVMGTMKFTSK